MAYKHGVYVEEQSTSLLAPITGSAGLQVVIGTAPVNMLENPAAAVNTPLLAYTYKEAVAAVGYSDDFENYTICESISAAFSVVGVGPIVMINVLDPTKHNSDLTVTSATVTDKVAKLTEKGILINNLTVKNGSTTLVKDTDYTTSWNDDGSLNVILIDGGAGESATTLAISGKKLDPSKVTASDIVGGVDASTGKEKGLEVIRQIYPKLSLVPGILIAPRWSEKATVAAALQAKTTGINGCFKCVTFIDVDCSESGATKYTAVKTQKESQAITKANAYAIWLYAKVGDVIYSGSAIAAAEMAYVDAENSDTPYVSPSNKLLSISAACLADGTEVLLDQEQANTVNSYGVATFLNIEGFRLWGNNTAIYPSSTDPKDRWLSVRRFFNWTGNNFIRTYNKEVDDPLNPRLIEKIVDSENIKGNGFVARGVCARYEITFDSDENQTTDLLNGSVTFHQYLTPYMPAECITDVLEFDPDALSTLFN